MRTHERVAKHFHLPVQSGNDRVLAKMNRKYTRETYLEVVKKLRAAMPDITLTTDIIVGFPGETAEEFEDTLRLGARGRLRFHFRLYLFAAQGHTGGRTWTIP